jgi:hypothetical protein
MPSFPLRITILLVVFLAAPACKTRDAYYCEGAPNNNCLLADAARPCSSSSDCSGDQPVCDVGGSGVCVQCTPAEDDACGGATPACRDNSCQACVAHTECSDSNVCLPDGTGGDPGPVAYVLAGATGAPPCAQAAPCGTLQQAVDSTRPHIKVAAGIVVGADVTTIDGKAVTILADPGAKLDRTGDGRILLVRSAGANVSIYDLEITGQTGPADEALQLEPNGGTPALALVRVRVTGNQGRGISSTGGTLSISQSTISGNIGGGISSGGGTLTISQSTISGNTGGGIAVTGAGATFVVTNNYIFRNGDQDMGTFGGVSLGVAAAGTSRLEFNTVVDNRAASGATRGGGLVCDIVGFAAPNNIIARNSVGGSTSASTAQTLGACTYPSSRIQNDLSALNFASPDNAPFSYKLMMGSSAIDQATTASEIDIDHDGDARPQGQEKDIGADEHRP